MFGGSFSEEQLYSSKCFLLALKDSHDCLREVSRHKAEEELYRMTATRLLQAKKTGLVDFKDGHVVKGSDWNKSDLSKLSGQIR